MAHQIANALLEYGIIIITMFGDPITLLKPSRSLRCYYKILQKPNTNFITSNYSFLTSNQNMPTFINI